MDQIDHLDDPDQPDHMICLKRTSFGMRFLTKSWNVFNVFINSTNLSTNVETLVLKHLIRSPMTYDNNPNPSHSSVPHIALNELIRPKIDLSGVIKIF